MLRLQKVLGSNWELLWMETFAFTPLHTMPALVYIKHSFILHLLVVPCHLVVRHFLVLLSVPPDLVVLYCRVDPGDQDDPVCVKGQEGGGVSIPYVLTERREEEKKYFHAKKLKL